MDWGVPIGLALLFAVLVGWGLQDAEDAVAQLHLERARADQDQDQAELDQMWMTSDGLIARMPPRHGYAVPRHGYAVRLVLENGEAIGVMEGTPLTRSSYKAGDLFTYGATCYEIVALRDEWPEATGTVTLRPSSSMATVEQRFFF